MRFVALLCLPALTYAQSTFEGKILDKESGAPVSFASVGIVGTSRGTVANLDGEFALTVPASQSIKITCVGYESLVAEAPAPDQRYILTPSNTRLKDLTIFGSEVSGERIVMRAMKAIKKNMYTKSFLQRFFYRHYCKDDSAYGRLIEAAVEVDKKKGYRMQRSYAGQKEQMRVTQIRRSFDRTNVANAHMPIALTQILVSDPAGYQAKGQYGFGQSYVSSLKTYRKRYDFKVEGISSYDGKDVYVVGYKNKSNTGPGGLLVYGQSGTLYIATGTYAIVKAETIRSSPYDTMRTTVFYREWKGKYYPYHTVRNGKSFYPKANFYHNYHVELMSSEIVTGKYEKFKGEAPSRESLLQIPFDSAFWATYPIVKATPLEESIISDLGGGRSLNEQFNVYQKQELETLEKMKSGEANFNKFREDSRGKRILYVDFWASWCKPCLEEMKDELKIAAEYAGKVTFVMLSIDKDEEAWQKALTRFRLRQPGIIHYRIGPDADLLQFYITRGIPHYVLIGRDGEHFSIDAKRPSNPELRKDFEALLNGQDDK